MIQVERLCKNFGDLAAVDDVLRRAGGLLEEIERDAAARERLADGRSVTAVELQSMLCERARAFVDAGGVDGLVPDAPAIVELWEDTLDKLDILFTRLAEVPKGDGRVAPKDTAELMSNFKRLAEKLEVLPRVKAKVKSGELGYTKAREIVKVATPATSLPGSGAHWARPSIAGTPLALIRWSASNSAVRWRQTRSSNSNWPI